MPEIRPFARHDRDQLTSLVNAHIKAVAPGCSVPTAALLNQMERDPGEYIVDPWVIERETWVAIERERIAAAAHLHRFGTHAPVGPAYQNAAEICWFVCWPEHLDAGRHLMASMTRRLDEWSPRVQYLDVSLPSPLAYGVHDAWPHLRVLAEEAGFSNEGGRTEIQLVAALDRVMAPGGAPIDGVRVRRRLHAFGAAFTAMLGDCEIGLLEVDDDFTRNGTMLRCNGWADVSNLTVAPEYRRKGVATWLLRHATEWLRMGDTRNLIAYLGDEEVGSAQITGTGRWASSNSTERSEVGNANRYSWRRLAMRTMKACRCVVGYSGSCHGAARRRSIQTNLSKSRTCRSTWGRWPRRSCAARASTQHAPRPSTSRRALAPAC